jgi:tRNA (guanine-N7-)-methyltransferase
MTEGQKRALDELWPQYGVANGDDHLDLDELFGRTADKIFEIGFGNGESLVASAIANPGADFLGAEVHAPGIGHCLLGARKAGLENLRVVMDDAVRVLELRIADAALARANLLFPDPWPKKRHHKRRIVQPPFLRLLAAKIRPGGVLYIATDWADYARHIDEIIAEVDEVTVTERREHCGDRPLDRPGTHFERRGLKLGHRIVDWCLQRI